MRKSPFDPARTTSGRRLAARAKTLRRASLLIGTSCLLQAAPAWAANECGPPPPGGGTVICPAGLYPDGISYSANGLELVLEPGLVSARGTSISSYDLRLLGPVDTKLNSDSGGAGLYVQGVKVFAHVDDVSSSNSARPAVSILGYGSVTFFADTVVGVGGGVDVGEGLFSNSGASPGSPGTYVRVNNVTSTKPGEKGVNAVSIYGNVRVEVGSVTSGGIGIEALGGLFNQQVYVEAGTVVTTNGNSTGIRVFGRHLEVRSGTIVTSGPRASGIEAYAGLGNIVIASGSISTQGREAPGIRALSELGDIRIASGSISTTGSVEPGLGQAPGIWATTVKGDVTIASGSISTTGFHSDAIKATTTDGDVTVTSEKISTTGFDSVGIRAARLGSDAGTIIIDSAEITTMLPESPGIHATAAGSGLIDVTSDSILASGEHSAGIFTRSSGGEIRIDGGKIVTTGSASPGIDALAASGASLKTTSITTSGIDSPGILATVGLFKPLNIVSGTIRTDGFRSAGIEADGGTVRVESASVTTTGRSAGIDAATSTGDISVISGSVVTGGAGDGAFQGAGIMALAFGGNASVVSGSVATTGTEAFGIWAVSGGFSSTGKGATITSNSISTTGRLANGIYVLGGGSVTVTSGTIITLGDSASGIVALSPQTPISIKTGFISTRGFDGFGVLALSTGTGAIDIASDNMITTTGDSSPGISAESGGQVVVSANNVSVTGANSDAIAVKGSTSRVTIKGLVESSQGFAVRGEGGLRQGSEPGGPVTVDILAGGTVRGRVSLTGGADRIANSGIFDAIGTSGFGGGADSFDNGPGATLRAVNGSAAFAELESFGNGGLVELRDGATNDILTLPGAYSGTGAARLGLDVDLTSGTADRLVTGAATGSTTIDLRVAGQTAGLSSSILLVDAGAGTSATAFSLGDGPAGTPYLRSTLRFDPAGTDFRLVQAPGTAVFETARFGGMATRLWYESADAVAAQLDSARDGRGGRGLALWLQGWTGRQESRGAQTFGGATTDVSFDQDFQGLQGGLDYGTGGVVVGLTGGAGRSDAVFAGTGDPVDIEVRNIGAYLQGRSGPFFFNALGKFDWAELEIAPGAGLGASFDADLLGVQANAGLRFDLGAFYAEPSIGLSWVSGDLDSFESGPATVAPGDSDSLRARAGLRVGARLPVGSGTLLPFAAVDVFDALDDGNETDFTFGETLNLFDESADNRGRAAAGVSFVAAGFEAFVRGEMDFSGGADAKSVRAGARLRF
jgi:hypothetical protein